MKQYNIVPRVAAIQDMSGFGRCSLTVIMPILACMGIQVCPLPTAVLSTHTGGFGEVCFKDLTDTMEKYMAHWESLQLKFDYIYTGFLGNEKQIDMVVNFCRTFKKTQEEIVVVDPVMGDNGQLYKSYNKTMQEKMRLLVAEADIITPNLTELMFLLKRDYENRGFAVEEIKNILIQLAQMGPRIVIVTGMMDEAGNKVNVAYDKDMNTFWKVPYTEISAHYPGTGDAFTSVLIGALVQGDSLPMAINRAANFISLAIKTTYGYGEDPREGIMLEKVLPELLKRDTRVQFDTL